MLAVPALWLPWTLAAPKRCQYLLNQLLLFKKIRGNRHAAKHLLHLAPNLASQPVDLVVALRTDVLQLAATGAAPGRTHRRALAYALLDFVPQIIQAPLNLMVTRI